MNKVMMWRRIDSNSPLQLYYRDPLNPDWKHYSTHPGAVSDEGSVSLGYNTSKVLLAEGYIFAQY